LGIKYNAIMGFVLEAQSLRLEPILLIPSLILPHYGIYMSYRYLTYIISPNLSSSTYRFTKAAKNSVVPVVPSIHALSFQQKSLALCQTRYLLNAKYFLTIQCTVAGVLICKGFVGFYCVVYLAVNRI
jgi:hypothetical protein